MQHKTTHWCTLQVYEQFHIEMDQRTGDYAECNPQSTPYVCTDPTVKCIWVTGRANGVLRAAHTQPTVVFRSMLR